jgi:transketolase
MEDVLRDMRKVFASELYKHMQNDKDIFLLTGGVGYGVLDAILEDFQERAINCEASEQAMIDIAVGLCLQGKIPFVYAITPHLFRGFEGIRIYLDYYQIPVKLVGVGRGRDYENLGFTHWGEGDEEIFETLKNIEKRWPTEEELPKLIEEMVASPKPFYVNLSR